MENNIEANVENSKLELLETLQVEVDCFRNGFKCCQTWEVRFIYFDSLSFPSLKIAPRAKKMI